jgi:Homeodomain
MGYLSAQERDKIASQLGLASTQVQMWFQTRRSEVAAACALASPSGSCNCEAPAHEFQSVVSASLNNLRLHQAQQTRREALVTAEHFFYPPRTLDSEAATTAAPNSATLPHAFQHQDYWCDTS